MRDRERADNSTGGFADWLGTEPGIYITVTVLWMVVIGYFGLSGMRFLSTVYGSDVIVVFAVGMLLFFWVVSFVAYRVADLVEQQEQEVSC